MLKKTAHITEYAILFLLVWRAAKSSFKSQVSDHKLLAGVFLFCLLYAVSDEFHQSFVIGRTSTIRDVGFDVIGMFISYWYVSRHNIKEK